MKYKKLILASCIASAVGNASAASITLTGTLETKKPEPTVNITTQGDLVAFVKELTANVESEADGCKLVATESEAIEATSVGTLACLIEWEVSPGVVHSDMKFTGIPTEFGEKEQRYTVSYFSGSEREKVTISTGSIVNEILEPIAPKVTRIATRIGLDITEGNENTIYNKGDSYNNVVIELEPRNYEQKIDVQLNDGFEHGCILPQGESMCSMSLAHRVGNNEDDEEVGVENGTLNTNSSNDYFNQEDYQDNIAFNWDYRAAKVKEVHFNAIPNYENKIVQVDGQDYIIRPGQGIVVVESPHVDKDGDWWKPRRATLTFNPDPDKNEVEPFKSVDGNTLFTGRTLTWLDQYDLTTEGSYSFTGQHLVYTVDLKDVPDGSYDIDTTVQDPNYNIGERNVGEQTIARDAPQIKLFDNYSEVTEGRPLYFMDHLIAAGFNNFVSGMSIDQVTIADQNVLMSNGIDPSVKYLSSQGLDLVPHTTYEMEVKATDMSGTQVVHTQNVIYAPVKVNIRGEKEPQYKDVTELQLYVNYEEGKKCSPAASEDIAHVYGTRTYFTCTVEWFDFPEGMAVDEDTLGHELHGVMRGEEDKQSVSYRLKYFDGEGNSLLVTEDRVDFDLMTPEKPEISALASIPISSDMMAVELTGGSFGYASVLSAPAKIEMTMEPTGLDKEPDYYYWRERPNRRDATALQKGSAKLYTDPAELWSTQEMKLNANYKLAPEYTEEKIVDVVYVPPKRTKAYARLDTTQGLTTENFRVAARVGIFHRRLDKYDYASDKYGNWNLTLVKQINNRDYEDVAGPIVYDGQSEEVFFDMDGSDWLGSNRFCVKAEVDSPIEGFEQSALSRCVRMAVFKGEGIEGDVISRRLIDKAPFDMAARYQFESTADRDSAENIIWQISKDDGSTWERYQRERDYPSSIVYRFEEAGKWKVRAQATNKFTSVITYSEPLEVIAYDVPEVEIQGPSSVYTGELAEIKLHDLVTQSDAEGEIEWSIDGGSTWSAGESSIILDSTQVKLYKVRARMRYDDIDAGVDKAWDEDLHYVKVKAPEKPSVAVKAPKEGEVGTEIFIEAKARASDRTVEMEWVLPNGDIIQGSTLSHVLADNGQVENIQNRIFYLKAWMQGYKSETTTTRKVVIKTWKYTMPDISMKFDTSVKYAPAFIRARINLGRVYAPGVSYTYELETDPNQVEIISQNENVFELKLKDAKTHPIKAIVRDSRGGSNDFMEFFDVLEPLALDVDIAVRSYSNKQMREPLTAYLQAKNIMPHKRDSIKSYEWQLNGIKQNHDDVAPNYWTIEDLPEGEHAVTLKAITEFGQESEKTLMVSVVDNIKPECSITFKQTNSALNFDSSCHDKDGSVVRHEWLLDGDAVSISERLNYFKYPHLQDVNTVTVTLRVYDDSFEFTEYTDTYPVTH